LISFVGAIHELPLRKAALILESWKLFFISLKSFLFLYSGWIVFCRPRMAAFPQIALMAISGPAA